jgi:hypothetical protein
MGTPPLGIGTPPHGMGTPPRSRQGTPLRSRPFNSQAPERRSGSPLGGRSPRMSFRASRNLRKSFSNEMHDALGDSIPHSGAATLDDTLPGRGLCVSMQRGLTRPSVAGPTAESFTKQMPHNKEHQAFLVPANRYEACVEDPIDRCFERLLRQAEPSASAALLVRRFGPGEYEVDGARISVGWRRLDSGQREAFVFDRNGPSEPLGSYLRRATDVALARVVVRSSLHVAPAHGSFTAAGSPQPPQPMSGSFFRSDTGSFYGGHEVVAPGSFYSNYSNTARRQGPKDGRVEAMNVAGMASSPVVMPSSVSFAHQASGNGSRQQSFVMPPVPAPPHHGGGGGGIQAPHLVSVRG